jgi:hypothetical protein
MIGEKISAAAGYTGSGTAVVFGLTPSEWSVVGVIGGLIIGVAGFLVNAYYGWRRLQIDEQRADGK